MNGPPPRPAGPGDADELTRLHVEAGLGIRVGPEWLRTHRDGVAELLGDAESELLARVVDAPDGAGLASAAVGFVHRSLPCPGTPTGLSARLASVTTLPEFRRRGYGRAVTKAFIEAARVRGCVTVSLNVRAPAEPLYRSLGFIRLSDAMALDLVRPEEGVRPGLRAGDL